MTARSAGQFPFCRTSSRVRGACILSAFAAARRSMTPSWVTAPNVSVPSELSRESSLTPEIISPGGAVGVCPGKDAPALAPEDITVRPSPAPLTPAMKSRLELIPPPSFVTCYGKATLVLRFPDGGSMRLRHCLTDPQRLASLPRRAFCPRVSDVNLSTQRKQQQSNRNLAVLARARSCFES